MSADVERPGSFPSHADMASSTRMPPPPLPLDQSSSLEPHTEDSSMQKTPTRDSFIAPKSQPASNKRDSMSMSSRPSTAGGEEEQRPSSGKEGALDRATSVRSIRSTESQDISMDGTEDGRDQSDQESEAGSDGERPSKKKKGQRFFCTEYPPCSLSFTRSEHLARHIRKHTGERPFVCHCLRRFSRLDNLRQHAQTVHVNEEIPSDSLAATGTRFQRQIRTDRMRTPGVRNRSSTLNSASGHVRGHQRNWSNSSIGSMTSELSTQDDSRRRPPPLAMANIPTHSRGLSLDTYAASAGGRTPDSSYATFYQQSPSGFSTPVSAFSQGPGSPMHTSSLQSPIAFSPRSLQYGDRTPSRRLSVPSSSHPYQQHSHPGPYYNQVPPPYMSPPQSSAASVFPDMPNVFAMPGSPAYPTESRRDTFAEADPRRRTWHPGGWGSQPQYGRPATSGLSYHRTPDALQIMASSPLQTTAAASQGVRLPGIDSFDRAKEQRSAPPRRATSPMDVDSVASHSRRSSIVDTPSKNLDRAGSRDSWGSINQHLTQLDLERFREAQPAQVLPSSASPSFPDPSPLLPAARPVTAPGNQSSPIRREQAQTDIQTTTSVQEVTDPKTTIPEPPATPRRAKRQAWYAGPLVTGSTAEIITPVASAVIQVHRTSPEGSSSSDGLPTPFTAASSEVRPAIMHANGYIEAAQPSHESQAQDVSVVAAPKQASSYSVHSDYAPKTRTLQQDLSRPVAQPSQHSQQPSTPSTPSSRQHENTDRLDALVAVATQAVHHQ